jgi:hypothetical protein
MPTTRRRRRPAFIGLSEAMIEAWLAGDRAQLNHLCQIKPWQISPLDTIPSVPPPLPDADTMRALPHAHAGWHRATALRQALRRYGEPGR